MRGEKIGGSVTTIHLDEGELARLGRVVSEEDGGSAHGWRGLPSLPVDSAGTGFCDEARRLSEALLSLYEQCAGRFDHRDHVYAKVRHQCVEFEEHELSSQSVFENIGGVV